MNIKSISANSALFILYKNQKQTLFSNLDEVTICKNKIILTRSAHDKIVIDLNSVKRYKVY